MAEIKILWADDEIELLKPQIFFLTKKGYDVNTVSNGHDALDAVAEDNTYDIVFLDESMPGITGLETLEKIKQVNPNLPVVMITKNEAESIMDDAIGSEIADYLIKPVNPNQILLSIKKIIDNRRLVSQKTAQDYQVDFRQLSMDINDNPDHNDWVNLYRRIINWELKLDNSDNDSLLEILLNQRKDANKEFVRFVEKNYEDWHRSEDGPVMSHTLMRKKVLPKLSEKKPILFLLLDNLRYDQWKVLESTLSVNYKIDDEDHFYSILPTSTQYSRNAIFSGMSPLDISKHHKDKWVYDHEKGGKNMHEEFFFKSLTDKVVKQDCSSQYVKVRNAGDVREMMDKINNLEQHDITLVVYNFIDMLSHARTEMDVLKELAGDETAYRSLTKSWFENSPLYNALNALADKDYTLIITTDHGTTRVSLPSKVIGDRETTTNLRYKVGKNLNYENSDVYAVKKPEDVGLPAFNISSTYVFAKQDRYFLYPNNYNYFLNLYADTFQHGGISLEEVICPYIVLSPK